ncbi:kallikrein 1-related peptidase b11-like [Mus caroli]|uniref:Kallikrein 1-related peptidase b11-like n=1 Tax=Mus caroli TaxID=10089 RepID=A0A6P5Q1E0_MUSCR|nr:kallikrein 1-related peptidase b11-like [Mus caroli]
MLLCFSKPAAITDAVKPINLPTEEPKLCSTCLASGLGSITPTKYEVQKPDDLYSVSNKLLPIEDCVKNHNQKVTDAMLWAGELGGGKDTSKGDSGGPLICDGVLQGTTLNDPEPCVPRHLHKTY